tara:strand:- start:526 stop:930 length:405 start_codon:yes stop_codon:yes gene_type:complete
MDTGKRIPLVYKQTECGRNPNCGIHVNDLSVSSKHAIIELSSDFKKAFICDKGAMHGCYINELKMGSMDKKRLQHNDVLRFGTAKLRFKVINTKSEKLEQEASDSDGEREATDPRQQSYNLRQQDNSRGVSNAF